MPLGTKWEHAGTSQCMPVWRDGRQCCHDKGGAGSRVADVLLVLGTNLKTYLCEQLTGYYKGDKLILISPTKHFSDRYADVIIHESVEEALGKAVEPSDSL